MKTDVKKLVISGVIAAVYAAVTLVLAPISFGAVQFRAAEALCVLPYFMPETALGLTLGCALSNMLGGFGLPDVIFGSLATFLAGTCTAWIGIKARKSGKDASWVRNIFACLMPAIFNAPIIGGVIASASLDGGISNPGFAVTAATIGASVGLDELAVTLTLGLIIMRNILSGGILGKMLIKNK